MNPLHSQRQQSPAGNVYSYGVQQDDFSTPFNDPNASFSDPSSLFSTGFNPGYPADFQATSDAVNEQSFQNGLGGHGQFNSFIPQQADTQAWQSHSYLEAPQHAYNPNLGQNNAFNGHPFGQQRMQPYDSDVNINYPFNNREYAAPRQAQTASTISPAVIDHSEGTILPSALDTSDDLWQDATMTEPNQTIQVVIPPRKAQTPPQQAATTTQLLVPAAPQYPSRPQHDHTELDKGVPAGTVQSGFHVRDATEFQGSAKAEPVAGWIYLSKETFETNESRLASLPEAPMRSSINQLRVRLNQSDFTKGQDTARSRLEEKLKKREKKDKGGKRKKDKAVLLKSAPSLASKAEMPAAQDGRSNADDSESEDYSDSSDSGSGSDYDGDSDRDDEPSPLPKEKPKDEVGATRYEIVQAVWASSSRRLTNEALKTRFGPWLEIVQRVRKEWRLAPDETSKTEKKSLLEEVFRLTAKHGHHNLVQSLDQLTPLASVVAASVTELVKAEKLNDGLIEAILLMFMKFGALKWPFIVQTKLHKLLPRVAKGAKGNLKPLAEMLIEKINASEKAHQEAEKKPSENDSSIKKVDGVSTASKPIISSKERIVTDVKRVSPVISDVKKAVLAVDSKKSLPAASDGKKTTVPVNQKKAVAPTPGRVTLGALAKGQAMVRTGSSDSADSKTAAVASANPAATKEKERTRYVVTKPPSVFSGISASKKPGTALSTTKTAVKDTKPAVKAEVKAPVKPAAPRVPGFSFSELLASVDKPKEEAKIKKESTDKEPPETEEERKKRLRKESRRHLRVTWQPDDKLCQIKLFDHGLEDEIAHAAADVKDLKDEGRAFKREYRQQHNKMDDLEQDFIKESDDVLDPEPTDFGEVGADQLELNVTSRANGQKPVESAEAEEQTKREHGVMIAIYATLQDIPYSPREPPTEPWSAPKAQYDFGFDKTKHDWVLNRSARVMERMNAFRAPKPQPTTSFDDIMKNLNQFSQVPRTHTPPQQNFPGAVDPNVQSLLAQLGGGGGGGGGGTNPPAPAQSNPYDPQAAINLFMSMQQNQSSVPAAAPQPQAAAPPANDLSSILSKLNAMNPQAQAQPQPQPPQQTAPMAPQQQTQQNVGGGAIPGVDPDILAFLSQYNHGPGQSSQPAAQQTQPQQQWSQPGTNLFGLLGQQQQQQPQQGNQVASAPMFGTQWNQQSQQQQPQMGGNGGSGNSNGNERKRGHDDDAGGGRGKKKKPYFGEPKVPCKYWSKGKCHFGDECTFKHD